MPRYSQSTRKGTHKKAWQIFSKYIRFVRDKGVCYTCGSTKDPREMDAGHYKHSDSVDFDEMNIHCQCVNCNRNLHGNPKSYRLKLVQQYGEDKVLDLEKRAKKTCKDTWQIPEQHYELIISTYNPKIMILKKEQ